MPLTPLQQLLMEIIRRSGPISEADVIRLAASVLERCDGSINAALAAVRSSPSAIKPGD
jgi:F420-0:gamma-glutamyl ligase